MGRVWRSSRLNNLFTFDSRANDKMKHFDVIRIHTSNALNSATKQTKVHTHIRSGMRFTAVCAVRNVWQTAMHHCDFSSLSNVTVAYRPEEGFGIGEKVNMPMSKPHRENRAVCVSTVITRQLLVMHRFQRLCVCLFLLPAAPAIQ